MTLKQKRLIAELPGCKFNVTKAGKKAGYADNYAETKLHSDVRKSKLLEKYFNEDEIKLDIARTKKRLKKSEDNTNYCRLLELQTKIKGMQIDKSENRTEVTVKPEEKEELIKLRNSVFSLQ